MKRYRVGRYCPKQQGFPVRVYVGRKHVGNTWHMTHSDAEREAERLAKLDHPA